MYFIPNRGPVELALIPRDQNVCAYEIISACGGRWRACRAALRGELATYESAALRGELATDESAALRGELATYESAALRGELATYESEALRGELATYESEALRGELAIYESHRSRLWWVGLYTPTQKSSPPTAANIIRASIMARRHPWPALLRVCPAVRSTSPPIRRAETVSAARDSRPFAGPSSADRSCRHRRRTSR